MKKQFILLMFMFVTISHAQKEMKIKYPQTKKTTTVDVFYSDIKVEDPYRWLEDDRSSETEAWVKEQNKLTYGYLEKIPYRNQIKNKIESLMNYERYSAPSKEGNYIYFQKNNGLQNQAVLYRKDNSGKEEVFLDPNTFSKNGTTSLGGLEFSKDGSKLAYSISEGGSDWRKVIVIDVITKKAIEDTLINIKFSGLSWKDNEGFYYSSYDKPTGSELSSKTDQHKLYYHKLGTPQKNDVVVFGLDKKIRYITGDVTEDGTLLIIYAANSTYGKALYIKDLSNPNSQIVPLITNYENDYQVLDKDGSNLFIITDFKAPNNRIVKVDLKNIKPEFWQDFIPETKESLTASVGGGYIFTKYLKDAISSIKQYDYSGKMVREVKLPGLGTASGFNAKKEDKTIYYSFTNYSTPTVIYNLDPVSGKSEIYRKPKIDFKTDDYVSKQIFYTSKDGTKIPMIITYKKDLKLNGKNPTILYGYGGFGISLTPSFSPANAAWLEKGGIYAVANLRGGGEYGKEWHDAGIKTEKQNVFDDFIAAAEYLIAQKYTSSDFLAIKGGSNGGLLVGAVLTQRPDLIKVALPAVGVLDMLRYHTFTAGAGWAYDYGTADDNKEMFTYLKQYSPVHNVKKETKYPAVLITTGDHDDRVVPAHSFKFAAELQEKQAGLLPTLIRIDVKAGHGQGKSTSAIIQENADIQSFTLFNMGIKQY